MKTVFIDVEQRSVSVIDIEDSLDVFYEKLDCNLIDIVCRDIGGENFDVMCDDEGLLRDDAKASACSVRGNVMFVGNLMIFKHTDDGRLLGLTESEVEKVMASIIRIDAHPILICEYVR